ncbi:unnamed protein product [Cunninghamella echinulata]
MQYSLSTQNLKEISMILDQKKFIVQEEEDRMMLPPPPYLSQKEENGEEGEDLPQYEDLMNELEHIMNQFPSRLEDQRGHHYHSMSPKIQKRNHRRSSLQINQLLDKMEKYRHQDQDFSTENRSKMNQLMKNMYYIEKKNNNINNNNSTYLSLNKKLKYQQQKFIQFFSSKKRINTSSKISMDTEKNDFDFFLNSIDVSIKQSQMLDQRALLIAA